VTLEDIVVHREHRGQGYGSDLLRHTIDFARKKNFLRITLLTDRPARARQFYLKHGFVESGMVPMRLILASEP